MIKKDFIENIKNDFENQNNIKLTSEEVNKIESNINKYNNDYIKIAEKENEKLKEGIKKNPDYWLMLEYREIEKKIKAIKEENYNYENYKYEIEKREIKIYNKDFNIENAFSYYETQGHTFIIEYKMNKEEFLNNLFLDFEKENNRDLTKIEKTKIENELYDYIQEYIDYCERSLPHFQEQLLEIQDKQKYYEKLLEEMEGDEPAEQDIQGVLAELNEEETIIDDDELDMKNRLKLLQDDEYDYGLFDYEIMGNEINFVNPDFGLGNREPYDYTYTNHIMYLE